MESKTVETIPADIALNAMELLSEGKAGAAPVTCVADAVFFSALDEMYDCKDHIFARAYGLSHWKELSETARKAWDWVFGIETRLVRPHCDRSTDRFELAILRRQEREER